MLYIAPCATVVYASLDIVEIEGIECKAARPVCVLIYGSVALLADGSTAAAAAALDLSRKRVYNIEGLRSLTVRVFVLRRDSDFFFC